MRRLLVPFGLKPKLKVENPYADMYVRSLAACIDVMILFVLFYDLFTWMDQQYFPKMGMDFLEHFNNAQLPEERAELIAQWITRNILQIFVFGVAIVGCQSIVGTTPGKWIMGLKIVRAKTHAPVSSWRFLLRFLGYIPACGVAMIGMLWIGFNKERRGWHDYIAGTVVLNMRPYGWYWSQIKRGVRYLRGQLKSSRAVEEPMAEPTAAQRHDNSDKPVE